MGVLLFLKNCVIDIKLRKASQIKTKHQKYFYKIMREIHAKKKKNIKTLIFRCIWTSYARNFEFILWQINLDEMTLVQRRYLPILDLQKKTDIHLI